MLFYRLPLRDGRIDRARALAELRQLIDVAALRGPDPHNVWNDGLPYTDVGESPWSLFAGT